MEAVLASSRPADPPAGPATREAGRRSLAIPLLLAVMAPLAVIFCIRVLHSVWWTFAVYQVGICLAAPALESLLTDRGWAGHAALLGLRGSDRKTRALRRRFVAVGLGVATALATGGFLVLTHHRFLDPGRLEAALAGWGVAPGQVPALLAIVAMINAGAEELFWRGYLPGRIAPPGRVATAPAALTVVLPAVLYTSYHVATIGSLVGETLGVVAMTAGVLAAGLLWGWLRRRSGSVWPALLSHGGAVVAYLAVHVWLTRGGG